MGLKVFTLHTYDCQVANELSKFGQSGSFLLLIVSVCIL